MPKVEDIRQALRDGELIKAPEEPASLVPPPKVAGSLRPPDLPKHVMCKCEIREASTSGSVDSVAEFPDVEVDGAIYFVRRDGRLYLFDADDTTWKAIHVVEDSEVPEEVASLEPVEPDDTSSVDIAEIRKAKSKGRTPFRILREEGSSEEITDAQLLFGRYKMKRVTQLAEEPEGRNYLRWVLAECDLTEDLSDFITKILGPASY